MFPAGASHLDRQGERGTRGNNGNRGKAERSLGNSPRVPRSPWRSHSVVPEEPRPSPSRLFSLPLFPLLDLKVVQFGDSRCPLVLGKIFDYPSPAFGNLSQSQIGVGRYWMTHHGQ